MPALCTSGQINDMSQFTTLTSRVIPLPQRDVDTDQIIPARFLKVTGKTGLGQALFADWRYNHDGSENEDFVLNLPRHQGAQMILAGDNFGCGSSREHAPWALVGWGIRAILSTSFADIFRSNALKNGLLPVTVDAEIHKLLFDLLFEIPLAKLTIDLATQRVTRPDGSTFGFPIDGFSKKCLLSGTDQLGYILSHEEEISAYEKLHDVKYQTTTDHV